jgi:hypothetical protein
MMNMSTNFIILLAIPFALVIADQMNGAMLIKLLRTQFASTWKGLDEPELDTLNYASSRLKLTAFIWSFKFLPLKDSRLTAHCLIAIAVQIALLMCMAYGFYSFASR